MDARSWDKPDVHRFKQCAYFTYVGSSQHKIFMAMVHPSDLVTTNFVVLENKRVLKKWYVPRQNFSLPTQQKLQAEQRVSVSGEFIFPPVSPPSTPMSV
jgi:hypothetical protein